ncbi:MAG: bifunctional phosphopantothenoylcysteine decarboxylase/phosphopantothenate--cysteine ligase CoaBC [Clostridia bacterium]|nr:bifunctional phosphopantothenoylcysteine decarboxylase/phosphopantothenate--cysteine ligase CoaBC [Clostridia bacterium]
MKLIDKKILVGVTGGIAAYKTCDLVSQLVKNGADVRVIMTESAQKFIAPITFSALTGNPTSIHMFDTKENIPHIELVQNAHMLAVVPATANIIGKFANGIADDLLSSLLLAATCPIFFAPAMNINMYQNAAVQSNISRLKKMGIFIMEPDVGYLACGTSGKGRLPAPVKIFEEICNILEPKGPLCGCNVLVTAGGTREPIDPVRYIGNRSSGKMGYALAGAARKLGANVTVISTIEKPDYYLDKHIVVETAEEMYKEVLNNYAEQDIIIMAAAVADYMPINIQENKIKKTSDELIIKLKRTPDILSDLGLNKGDKILVGFAAETEELEKFAMDKLVKKNADLIIANDVSNPKIGFSSENNQVAIFDRTGCVTRSDLLPKTEIADIIINKIIDLDLFKKLKEQKGVDNHG